MRLHGAPVAPPRTLCPQLLGPQGETTIGTAAGNRLPSFFLEKPVPEGLTAVVRTARDSGIEFFRTFSRYSNFETSMHASSQPELRKSKIYRVTIVGSVVNLVLSLLKLAAGIFGRSGAMVADAVHSFSDLATDVVVIVFARISSKPRDDGHDYGHGKFETLATIIISLALGIVGAGIGTNSFNDIRFVLGGGELERPGLIAFVAALASIVVKEVLYRYTVRVGRVVNSPSVIANAWHHRSDALSSLGTLVGIGCAYFLGQQWRIADPIAALIVAIFILKVAYDLFRTGLGELLEQSLPAETEQEILQIVTADPAIREPHNLRTRRIGAAIAIEVHVRVDGSLTVAHSHDLTVDIERRLRERFGRETMIAIHVEPIKGESTGKV